MKILFLAPRYPFPADTGAKIRTVNILKQLLTFANVHLVCFSFDPQDEKRRQEAEKLGARLTLVSFRDYSLLRKILNVSLGQWPYTIAKYYSSVMVNTLKHIRALEVFDAVHIDHLHMAPYAACCAPNPCFLDEHNIEYKILERCIPTQPWGIQRALYQHQMRKMKTFELKKIREFKGVFVCSSLDQETLNHGSDNLASYIIPNGVDTQFFSAKEFFQEDSIVFTGSLDWYPNDDAMMYFCKKIFPLIWKKKPTAKLYVVGRWPSRRLRHLAARDRRIIMTGCVDDVRPYVKRAGVFVVPLRIGGGTRLKILEAMAMSKAVVSTGIGAEGIEYTVGENILIAESPRYFSDLVLFLLNSRQKAQEIGAKARKLVLERYDWNLIGKRLREVYERQ